MTGRIAAYIQNVHHSSKATYQKEEKNSNRPGTKKRRKKKPKITATSHPYLFFFFFCILRYISLIFLSFPLPRLYFTMHFISFQPFFYLLSFSSWVSKGLSYMLIDLLPNSNDSFKSECVLPSRKRASIAYLPQRIDALSGPRRHVCQCKDG